MWRPQNVTTKQSGSKMTNQYKALQDAVFDVTSNESQESMTALSEALRNAEGHLQATQGNTEGEEDWIRLLNLYSIGAKLHGSPFYATYTDAPPPSTLPNETGASISFPNNSDSKSGMSDSGSPTHPQNSQTPRLFPDLKPSLPKRNGLHSGDQ